MNTVWTVLMVILFVLFPIYRGARKQLDNDQRRVRRGASAVGGADDAEADEDMETPYGVDGLGEPYFSYENGADTERVAPKSAPRQQAGQTRKKPQPAVAIDAAAPQFDLRQAITYQTVLNNPYVSEINKSIQ